MKTKLKQALARYFSSWWMPSLFVLSSLVCLILNEIKLHLPYVGIVLLLFVGVGFLGILISSLVQFAKKHPLRGAINLFALPVVGWIVFRGIGFLFVFSLFNDEPDDFGKNIVIPPAWQ